MYALVRIGGKQFKVRQDDVIRVPLRPEKVGEVIEFDEVLSRGEGGGLELGRPRLEGAKVSAEVLAHGKEAKLRVFKIKRRKNYRRTQGHRTGYTELKIRSIS